MKVKLFNASLESFDVQCDSRVFAFKPRSWVETEDVVVANLVYENNKHRGVFQIFEGMDESSIKGQERKALLHYMQACLVERIQNHNIKLDEMRRRGVTTYEDPALNRALRWQKEIKAKLEFDAPIEDELSFLEDSERERFGISQKNAVYLDNLFDPEKIKAALEGKSVHVEGSFEQDSGSGLPKKAGIVSSRKNPVSKVFDSFSETNLGSEVSA